MSQELTPELFYERARAAAATVCASEPGRILLEYLALEFHLGHPLYQPGQDALQTLFNDGSRFVVLKIMEMAGLTRTEDVSKCLKMQTWLEGWKPEERREPERLRHLLGWLGWKMR